jgi:hypothetical protein
MMGAAQRRPHFLWGIEMTTTPLTDNEILDIELKYKNDPVVMRLADKYRWLLNQYNDRTDEAQTLKAELDVAGR